jgi:hypothetical protein
MGKSVQKLGAFMPWWLKLELLKRFPRVRRRWNCQDIHVSAFAFLAQDHSRNSFAVYI